MNAPTPPPPPSHLRPPPKRANPALLARYLLDKAAELDLQVEDSQMDGDEGEGDGNKGKRVKRYIVALAGIPGAGKSTFSSLLLSHITQLSQSSPTPSPSPAIVIPQDGFHLPLSSLPPSLVPLRGSPPTFNPEGLLALVRRLRVEERVEAPGFDHSIGDPVPAEISVERHHRIVILEGSFLLLSRPPWSEIAQEADERWFLSLDPEVAFERVVKRHLEAGLEKSEEEARRRARGNDARNGEVILREMVAPDRWLEEEVVVVEGGGERV